MVVNKIVNIIALCIILFGLSTFGSGCSNLFIIPRFTYCYNGINTGIDTLCKVDGVYRGKFIHKSGWVHYYAFMLYRDGTIVGVPPGRNNETIAEYRDFLHQLPSKGVKNPLLNTWGRYIIVGDTIKAQMIVHGNLGAVGAFEQHIRIINDSTLIKYQITSMYGTREERRKKDEESKTLGYYSEAYFIPLENRPDSTCWLKKRRWFYCKE